MKPLFSFEGLDALQRVVRRAPLFAFDFDGTLTPIVDRPQDAFVSSRVANLLARVATLRPVAIVTGRSVADVNSRLGFSPQFIAGNHGAEDATDPSSPHWIDALDGLRASLRARAQELAEMGVLVEDKRYSVALHYRQAVDRGPAERLIHALVTQAVREALTELRVFGGKFVINVMADEAPDKGMAVSRLVGRSGSQAAFFVGDDLNDEAVFSRAPAHWLTVKVGRDNAHSQAQYAIDHSDELETLLTTVLTLLQIAAGHPVLTQSV